MESAQLDKMIQFVLGGREEVTINRQIADKIQNNNFSTAKKSGFVKSNSN